MVRTDPTRLRQVVTNLIGNAIKFTETGSVTIRVASSRTAQDHTILRIEVADTGIGMSEEQMARLFRPFAQADSTMSRRFGGTGLGLSISLRLCELMGGTISVTSVSGGGSTFVATIDSGVIPAGVMLTTQSQCESTPESASLPAPTGVAVATVPAARHGPKVLYAEDGPDNQRLISFYLRKAGFEIVLANNGREAVEYVEGAMRKAEAIDLILMDMQMPEMSGYEATAALRAMGWRGPIMSLTAHAMVGDQEKCAEAGCDHHMTKPVNREAFIELCTRLCQSEPAKMAA
jgi:CheY-like chemotaxis protein